MNTETIEREWEIDKDCYQLAPIADTLVIDLSSYAGCDLKKVTFLIRKTEYSFSMDEISKFFEYIKEECAKTESSP